MGVKGKKHIPQTHCNRGHELTSENTGFGTGGRRFCKICRRASHRRHYKTNPQRAVLKNRKRTMRLYGLTIEKYDKILEKQNSVCSICSGRCVSGKRLSVDHNHLTGAIRGLLCQKCNQGIGLFNDKPPLLIAAANYLDRHPQ